MTSVINLDVTTARTVERRDEVFAETITTKIWREQPSTDNPYIAQSHLCHGYELSELIQKRSFTDVLYLLFRGELPSKDESSLLEKLLIAFINPGPRHPATRAAMNAGVGKTDASHILPIGLILLGGDRYGGGEVEVAMRFVRKHCRRPSLTYLQEFSLGHKPSTVDKTLIPGFGQAYFGIDIEALQLAENLLESTELELPTLRWSLDLSEGLQGEGLGILRTGVAAAVLSDLGFQPRVGAGFYQLMGAPGILAHGLEYSNKPMTAMPFVKDSDYVIED
ncbi:citrate/2-methylcitrate synthase [Teredinibacter waterburyi]|uniref:citrate/2-methylcitrate synthase n=1 Tax=Teredinibacter waterburyi TaxID=1500538 RepID=UPI00165F74CD|nr:citrate/2-methylcitrate synthase [Teredinibacter waterburyi]